MYHIKRNSEIKIFANGELKLEFNFKYSLEKITLDKNTFKIKNTNSFNKANKFLTNTIQNLFLNDSNIKYINMEVKNKSVYSRMLFERDFINYKDGEK